MAYRRKHVMTRSATFVEDCRSFPDPDGDSLSSPSLAAQAIRASAAHRHSASFSSAYGNSTSVAAASGRRRLSQESNTVEYTSMKSLTEPKHGFWGVLARKAKAILEDDNDNGVPNKSGDYGTDQPQTRTSPTSFQNLQSNSSSESYRKPESPAFQRGSEAIKDIGGRIRNAFEEGLTMVENRTADIIQETRKLQIGRKNSSSNLQNLDVDSPNLSSNQSEQETQLKASRDAAYAMAAKAKLHLRQLKTVKADLAFAKERCAQLEEENKMLRENRQKGNNSEDDDLIRLQLETLLAEKARLAHENSLYARENRFLREIVEFHQLTMQDVVHFDEEDIEEVDDVDPIEMLPNLSPIHTAHDVHSSAIPSPPSPTSNPNGQSSPNPSVRSGSPISPHSPKQHGLETPPEETKVIQ
ncbi:uncharacterized protein LOC109728113 [Ananas comosus]|uniref:Uncharacterized protein LOC109728113 n=1 Tax=Ananas comosus TaxID=4615 RepID=A0A6P5HFJ0_ANACO|nr:uncharacterized protein LOC109728113 [Ananas comosus]